MNPLRRYSRPLLFSLVLLGVVILALAAVNYFNVLEDSRANSGKALTSAKISIRDNGTYNISLADLRRLGLEIKEFRYDLVGLSTSGERVPYILHDDRLVFYGVKPDDRYTPTRSYRLDIGTPGVKMQELGNLESNGSEIDQLSVTLHLEQNNYYDSRAATENSADGETFEPWFWQALHPGDIFNHQFEIGEVEPIEASLTVYMSGASTINEVEPDHTLEIFINNENVGLMEWDGETTAIKTFKLPGGLLLKGENEVTLDNSGADSGNLDIMRLDWLELTYPGPPEIESDYLEFTSAAGSLDMASLGDDVLVMDISDPLSPRLLNITDTIENETDIEIFGEMKLAAASRDGWKAPADISLWHDSDLNSYENQADLVIISPSAFVEPLESLAEARNQQGITTIIASVEEIYDNFNFGNESPQAITEFLRYTSSSWTDPEPRYVLLVGDATYDYKNYLGKNPAFTIPSPMVPVNFSGETVSDARLVDLDGDLRPDMAVGRWPVNDVDDVRQLVRRTLDYEIEPLSDRAIFTADGTSPEFSQLNASVIEESGFSTYPTTLLDSATADEFTDSWNSGAWFVSYAGHGSLDRWGKVGVFSSADIGDLASQEAPPIVLQLTCLTGFFAHPEVPSLSEVMLSDDDGPVLIVGATSLTLSSSQEPFGQNLLRALIDPEIQRIGDAISVAKNALNVERSEELREVSDTFILLGDPSAVIRRPDFIGSP